MKNFLIKVAFWDAMKDTFALFGPTTELIMMLQGVPEKYQFGVLVLTIGGYIGSHMIRIWIKDEDGDGKADIFQP